MHSVAWKGTMDAQALLCTQLKWKTCCLQTHVCLHDSVKEKGSEFISRNDCSLSWKKDILPPNTSRLLDKHVLPGPCREELFPVCCPKWKELCSIKPFSYQKFSPSWHGQQWPCSVLEWLTHSSTACDVVTVTPRGMPCKANGYCITLLFFYFEGKKIYLNFISVFT